MFIFVLVQIFSYIKHFGSKMKKTSKLIADTAEQLFYQKGFGNVGVVYKENKSLYDELINDNLDLVLKILSQQD